MIEFYKLKIEDAEAKMIIASETADYEAYVNSQNDVDNYKKMLEAAISMHGI